MADYKPIDYSSYPAVLQQFATYKIVIQNRSVNTVSDYLSDLRLFFRYLLMQRSRVPEEQFAQIDILGCELDFVKAIKKTDIYLFLSYMTDRHANSAAARARKLSAIKSFFKYLTVNEGALAENPAKDIEGPKLRRQLPKYLTLDESIHLLETVDRDTASKTRARDYAMLTLFLNCGMRLSELVGISIPDVDAELRSMRVVGKGNKERILYLNDACRAALTAYLQVRVTMKPPPEHAGALFLSSRALRISPKTVQWMVYRYLKLAGFENRTLSVHKLRHTAATLMYQHGGVDVRALMEILGHEQLTTTQIYTHVENEQLEEAISHNPLAKVRKKAAE